MSLADQIDIGQVWESKLNTWITYVVTGLSGDGWVRFQTVPNHGHGVHYALPVDKFVEKYRRFSNV